VPSTAVDLGKDFPDRWGCTKREATLWVGNAARMQGGSLAGWIGFTGPDHKGNENIFLNSYSFSNQHRNRINPEKIHRRVREI
jgi:hypothetical protein